jgi:uncharacterized membrane protein
MRRRHAAVNIYGDDSNDFSRGVNTMKRTFSTLVFGVLAAASLAIAACGGGAGSDSAPAVLLGPPTGTTTAACDAAGMSGITYAGFASGFFTSYCTRCHSTAVTGAARNGAPVDHNFDTLAGARLHIDHVDLVAGENPAGTVRNALMPISAPVLTDTERKMLSCWIVQGAQP